MVNPIFPIGKILIQFMFPPGAIIISILLLYWLLIFQKKKIATLFTLFLISFLFLLSSWLGEYILLRPLENKYAFNADITALLSNLSRPIIVVLSGDSIMGNLTVGKDNAEVGEITAVRLLGAYFLYRKIDCPILVSGGTEPGLVGNITSAEMMQQFLVNLGVPAFAILKETQSTNTRENAAFTLNLLRTYDFQEIVLVTSALHMDRAMLAFQNDNMTIIPAPVNFLYENRRPYILSILPNRSSWEHNLRALHEWVGYFCYRSLRGCSP